MWALLITIRVRRLIPARARAAASDGVLTWVWWCWPGLLSLCFCLDLPLIPCPYICSYANIILRVRGSRATANSEIISSSKKEMQILSIKGEPNADRPRDETRSRSFSLTSITSEDSKMVSRQMDDGQVYRTRWQKTKKK